MNPQELLTGMHITGCSGGRWAEEYVKRKRRKKRKQERKRRKNERSTTF